MATHAETVERLRRIYDLIRKYRPDAAIVFTLSPISLHASFRPVSCISANAVSKAKLRSAIDEVHQAVAPADPWFFYFPAYEVVMNGFRTPFQDDMRHPHVHVIDANMKSFERYFCTTALTDDDYRAALKKAKDLDAAITSARSAELDAMVEDMAARWKAERPRAPNLARGLTKQQRADDFANRHRMREERLAARAERLEARMRARRAAEIEGG